MILWRYCITTKYKTKKGNGWEVLGFVLHLDTWWISIKKATVGGRKEACDWPAKDSWISDIEDWTRDVGQLCCNEVIVRTCLYEVNHNKFHCCFRFLTGVTTVIQSCFGFTLLCFVIGLKISRHFLIQSEMKQKPVATRSCTFSRAMQIVENWLVHGNDFIFYDWPELSRENWPIFITY